MEKITHKQAQRRYRRLVWPVMAVYLLIVLGGTVLLNGYDPQPVWLATLIALASALPVIVVLFLLMRYIDETDEFSRLQHLKAMAWGAVATVGALITAGFLQMFDVLTTLDVFWFGIFFFLAYGLAYKAMGGKDCV